LDGGGGGFFSPATQASALYSPPPLPSFGSPALQQGQQLQLQARQAPSSASSVVSTYAPPPLPSSQGQAVARGGRVVRLCCLCELAVVEPVVLFTSKSVSVAASDLICGACAAREASEIEAVREAAYKRGVLDRPALPAPAEQRSAATTAAPQLAIAAAPARRRAQCRARP
jgi:hypothetical protein